jgi:rRNA maturation protein Nop10
LNSEKISKIQKKIVKRYGKYRRKVSWIVKRYENYGRNPSWIVKIFGKYRRKLWNDMGNMEEK